MYTCSYSFVTFYLYLILIYIMYVSYCYVSYKCCTAIQETRIPSEMCVGETCKGGPIPLFSDTFDTKYRAENFTDTDSDTDTNAYRYMVAIISHLLLYKYIDISV